MNKLILSLGCDSVLKFLEALSHSFSEIDKYLSYIAFSLSLCESLSERERVLIFFLEEGRGSIFQAKSCLLACRYREPSHIIKKEELRDMIG